MASRPGTRSAPAANCRPAASIPPQCPSPPGSPRVRDPRYVSALPVLAAIRGPRSSSCSTVTSCGGSTPPVLRRGALVAEDLLTGGAGWAGSSSRRPSRTRLLGSFAPWPGPAFRPFAYPQSPWASSTSARRLAVSGAELWEELIFRGILMGGLGLALSLLLVRTGLERGRAWALAGSCANGLQALIFAFVHRGNRARRRCRSSNSPSPASFSARSTGGKAASSGPDVPLSLELRPRRLRGFP